MRTSMTTLFAPAIAHATAGEGTAGAQPVAEIVTFRLVDGTDPASFISAADGMGPFLRSTGAMITRTLSSDENGLWTDHITWTSLEAAKTAANEMFQRPEAQPVMSMIDHDSIDMRHAPIYLQQE
ncbi:hypothetical protein [uncultured Tateyamaria sp.]|uniref:hypothetical protein n=1 Tax=uncultured Tateyamaria sp. TaxID=455651 RepID=UPI00262632D1|nr:hypothetical protein [uncultured Tateyamaria sp.]